MEFKNIFNIKKKQKKRVNLQPIFSHFYSLFQIDRVHKFLHLGCNKFEDLRAKSLNLKVRKVKLLLGGFIPVKNPQDYKNFPFKYPLNIIISHYVIFVEEFITLSSL